eukprot:40804_1
MSSLINYLFLIFSSICIAKQFNAESDGTELTCELKTEESKISAGNIFALAQDSPGANWYPARVDLNTESVTRLGGDLSFPYYQMGGISADPVNHFVSLTVENYVYTLSTITGDIINQVTPNNDDLKFFQYDYVSGRLIAMYWDFDMEEEHVVFVNLDGSIEQIVITTSCYVTNSARTLDYDNGIFYYMGIECMSDDDYLYAVNINDGTFDKIQLSTSVAYINFANGKLYSLAEIDSFALAEIDLTTGDVTIVNSNANIFESVIISDNTIDEANQLYIKFGADSNLLELISLDTGEIVTTVQFEQYIGPITFEPICICCMLEDMDEDMNETRRRLVDFDNCNDTSDAWKYNVHSMFMVLVVLVLLNNL